MSKKRNKHLVVGVGGAGGGVINYLSHSTNDADLLTINDGESESHYIPHAQLRRNEGLRLASLPVELKAYDKIFVVTASGNTGSRLAMEFIDGFIKLDLKKIQTILIGPFNFEGDKRQKRLNETQAYFQLLHNKHPKNVMKPKVISNQYLSERSGRGTSLTEFFDMVNEKIIKLIC